MADDVEQIGLNFALPPTSGSGGNASLGGTIDVDYTTNSVSGTLSASNASGSSSDQFSSYSLSYNSSSNTYTISATGSGSTNDALSFSYVGQAPSSVNNVALALGGTNYAANSEPVAAAAVCFTSGTRIRTTRGEVAVEDLVVGDKALTVAGAPRPIRWIGQRTLRPAEHRQPWNIHPVRVRAGAFGQGLPERDLLLSPGHPVLVGEGRDERLVPIMCLINGTTIERVPVEEVNYWHVELDAHDILFAEGLPAESYLDWGDRGFFDEASDHVLHNPDFVAPGLGARCRPVAVDGAVVDAERRRLDAVFATELGAMCRWPSQDLELTGN